MPFPRRSVLAIALLAAVTLVPRLTALREAGWETL
jgi:hypothetical protein